MRAPSGDRAKLPNGFSFCCHFTISMTYASRIGACSLERRLTWIRQSKQQQGTVDNSTMPIPGLTYEDLNNAVLENGIAMEMIQDWLQDCGTSVENTPETRSQHQMKGQYSKGNSLEDDFSLGAEAMLLFDNIKISSRVTHPQLKNMYLGNSMASNSTTKTCSRETITRISDVLTLYQEDAEIILYNLGFAMEVPSGIPDRFFAYPSEAAGIDFKLFNQCQRHRLEVEDRIYLQKNRETYGHKMSKSSQPAPPDFQSMINSAVAASMEKAIAKLLVQNPNGDPDTKDPDRSTGEIATSKRHWKGSGPAPRKAKGH
ncbi:TESPA1 isoform X1 [Pelobates cultripes]|uniref:TESPA1 isoform X1 n=1 Tax=Pelobates cultripes TaxID=61616 RepID=A0AAD1R692_PELCU|nr:TESPA1 isoform X1 [Pelobates cultripes]